uniref:Cdc23 domain-containing protein n=1 Tax=Parascaris univalens TaxID=6257 RepID=A0A915AXM4_PARUN
EIQWCRNIHMKVDGRSQMAHWGVEVLSDLHWLSAECERRCIFDSLKWANELIFYAPDEWHKAYALKGDSVVQMESPSRAPTTLVRANFGRSLMLNGEFHRAAYFLEKIKDESNYDCFMYYWAKYLAYEKDRLESEADAIDRRIEYDNSDMDALHAELCELGHRAPQYFDAFLFYVLGKVRLSLKLVEKAEQAFVESVRANRSFWPSWQELAHLISSPDKADTEEYVDAEYWVCRFFKADLLFRFHLHKAAIDEYEKIGESGFGDMPYLISQTAAALNYLQEHDLALEMFEKAHKADPLRVDQLHLYSDSLFVRGMRAELASLVHSFYRTHKFTWEVCCAVANYYSLRGDHEKSVVFLQRSLKLNPNNSSVWTLIGHEFMEQKNNSAACLAYRKAVQSDPKDYRGWYGLGQLYDILKMPSYSLYYYQQAHKCKSDDSRMLVALGEVYTRLNRAGDAQKCLLKAFKVGDVEGTALMLLGKLYEKEKNGDQAAAVYEKYLETYGDDLVNEADNMAHCCCFLAKHYLSKGDLNAAGTFAQRCLQYELSKEEGRSVLRQVSQAHRNQSMLKEAGAVVTSTPANESGDFGLKISEATPITPILPQPTVSDPLDYRQPNAADGGETEMAISSDEDSEGY